MQLAIVGLGVSYLLITPTSYTPTPTIPSSFSSSSSAQPANISIADGGGERDKGKRRGEDENEEVFKERWVRKSDQVVSQLYFFVSPLYQPIILNMHPKNLPFMFQTFDKQFINTDTMMLVSKRTEFDAVRIAKTG